MTISDIIQACQKQKPKAQKLLYDKYSRLLMGVIIRYLPDVNSAQDVLQETFIKIFKAIDKIELGNDAKIVAWMKKISVNESLRFLQKNKKHFHNELLQTNDTPIIHLQDRLEENDVLKMVRSLPMGYKIVFNLYVIEGYSHKEIAKKLEVSEATSRSQLLRARKLLQKKLTKLQGHAGVR